MTSFFVRRDNSPCNNNEIILQADSQNSNLFTGEQDFQEVFGQPTSLETDLLLISSAIFAADRACPRGEREDSARRIEINIPVINAVHLIPFQRNIESILRTLSNDGWRITFRQSSGQPESPKKIIKNEGRTLLFSGGLDSLAAAIEFNEKGENLQLISHKTRNQKTYMCQKELVEELKKKGVSLPHYQFFVSSKDGGPSQLQHDQEDSQRTRSFLFLILGALAAHRKEHGEIVYLAENGQMAIHLPLTQGRIGSFSTHTAHPDVIVSMEELLSNIFGTTFKITNPYVHKTKAEVVKVIADKFPELLAISHSCWRNARLPAGITHCGECIPCFIRRIAIEYCVTIDPTPYGEDPWKKGVSSLDVDNVARRNLADLTEFIIRIERLSNEEIMNEWPELYSVNVNSAEVISMYKRSASEAKAVLSRYSGISTLLI